MAHALESHDSPNTSAGFMGKDLFIFLHKRPVIFIDINSIYMYTVYIYIYLYYGVFITVE